MDKQFKFSNIILQADNFETVGYLRHYINQAVEDAENRVNRVFVVYDSKLKSIDLYDDISNFKTGRFKTITEISSIFVNLFSDWTDKFTDEELIMTIDLRFLDLLEEFEEFEGKLELVD